MPLAFSLVCDLLEQAHKLSVARKSNSQLVATWFAQNRSRIDAHDSNLATLLSTLLPEKRTDRVYCIQATTLEKIIGRAFLLGSSRIAELAVYKQPGLGVDLGECVARLLTVTPSPAFDDQHQVTVEEIDEILHAIASRIKWSSPSIRASQTSLTQGNRGDLEGIYRHLSSIEAKWFTRLVLKDYQPLVLDPVLIYRLCDPSLPCILRIQDDFTAAINVVQVFKSKLLPNSSRRTSRVQMLNSIKPQLGIKVGRQTWLKGRSIKHCIDMGHSRMSVEEKIDGEYCQIHVDLSKGENCIQIFSKSGKDSTEDREALHGVISESLRLGQPEVMLSKECILEGELVAYHDLEQKVLPFHKIRKHVSRRGRFLNTEQDSLPGPHEHLMIIYYDILLLDNQSLINVRHSERFKILSNLINCKKGYAELVQRQVVDFNNGWGASNLRKAFAQAILARKEGLVLKPDDPYFNFAGDGRRFASCCIKLKKEYIGKFGDVGDFAVVGARYDAAKARSYNISGLKWTHFYVGCLDNREEVKRWDAKPEFTVVNVVELNETMLKDIISFANPMPIPANENTQLELKLAVGVQKNTPMSVVFTKPLVFDLRCFSFDKEGNTGFWSLRFPMVTKVHLDRDFTDTISFEQLQAMAKDATTAPELDDSQENLEWIAKLEAADPRGIAVDAASQLTMTTMPTPSPRRSTQNTSGPWSPFSPTAARSTTRQTASPIQTRNMATRAQTVLLGPPLVTPPTSSAPTANKPEQADKLVEQRRSSPSLTSSSPRKRYKVDPTSSHNPLSSRQQISTVINREPLTEIADNSQTTTSSFASSVPAKMADKVVVDLTSSPSPESSFTTAVTYVRSSQNAEPSSSAQNTTTITVPDKSSVLIEVAPTTGKTSSPTAQHKSKDTIRDTDQRRCRYAAGGCRLAKSEILLAPDVLPIQEARQALKDHGIHDPVEDLEKWLQIDRQRAYAKDWQQGGSKIMLVDSIEKPFGTKILLEWMEVERESLPEDKRDWVTVYDWRVLNNITILEDDTITRKYYDGFHDPWRRWYCGLL